jgi:hypothetical protein
MVWLVDDLVELTRLFTEVAMRDPISALLLAVGTILVAVSVAVLAYLGAGALVDLLTEDRSRRAPPRRG